MLIFDLDLRDLQDFGLWEIGVPSLLGQNPVNFLNPNQKSTFM
jgi:hypothetical protein